MTTTKSKLIFAIVGMLIMALPLVTGNESTCSCDLNSNEVCSTIDSSKCFTVFNQESQIDIDHAKASCEASNLQLATILNENENDAVVAAAKSLSTQCYSAYNWNAPVYFAMRRKVPFSEGDQLNDWYTDSVNQVTSPYSNFASNEPNNWLTTNEECVNIFTGPKAEHSPYAEEGEWNDMLCDGIHDHSKYISCYACMGAPQASTCPCPETTNKVCSDVDSSKCFTVFNHESAITIEDAKSSCAAKNLQLATILNDDENTAVKESAGSLSCHAFSAHGNWDHPVFFDMRRQGPDSGNSWYTDGVNQTPATYVNWWTQQSQPDDYGQNEDCVVTFVGDHADGKWGDMSCNGGIGNANYWVGCYACMDLPATESPSSQPSSVPSNSPSTQPSSVPSDSPSTQPSSQPIVAHDETSDTAPNGSDSGSGAGGDPHFKTFGGHKFSFHGQCDLVLLRSTHPESGTNVLVYIRTTRVDNPVRKISYSYISEAAIKINSNVFEVSSDGDIMIDGKEVDNPEKYVLPNSSRTLKMAFHGSKQGIVEYSFVIARDQTIKIRANTHTRMIYVDVEGTFTTTEGLLGNDKGLYSRDGSIDMVDNWNSYSEEWQVLDSEPLLFNERRDPQYPAGCMYEDISNNHSHSKLRRRLFDDAQDVTIEIATIACAKVSVEMKEFCIYDVIATGNLDLADDPFYFD